jgi:hypothetical protein
MGAACPSIEMTSVPAKSNFHTCVLQHQRQVTLRLAGGSDGSGLGVGNFAGAATCGLKGLDNV